MSFSSTRHLHLLVVPAETNGHVQSMLSWQTFQNVLAGAMTKHGARICMSMHIVRGDASLDAEKGLKNKIIDVSCSRGDQTEKLEIIAQPGPSRTTSNFPVATSKFSLV